MRIVRDVIRQLLATDVALDKLGARRIAVEDAEQLTRNGHVAVRNPRERGRHAKRLLPMSIDPWTDPDPNPGDFDTALTKLDPRYVEHRTGDPAAALFVLVGVEGEDAKRLERISKARSKRSAAVVAELLRAAEHPLT